MADGAAPTIEGLMTLIEDFCFEAGKTAIYVAEGGSRDAPEHDRLKAGFESAEQRVRAYAQLLAGDHP